MNSATNLEVVFVALREQMLITVCVLPGMVQEGFESMPCDPPKSPISESLTCCAQQFGATDRLETEMGGMEQSYGDSSGKMMIGSSREQDTALGPRISPWPGPHLG